MASFDPEKVFRSVCMDFVIFAYKLNVSLCSAKLTSCWSHPIISTQRRKLLNSHMNQMQNLQLKTFAFVFAIMSL